MKSDALLVINIGCLVHTEEKVRLKYSGAEMSSIQTITDSYIFIKNGIIEAFGKADANVLSKIRNENGSLINIDAGGGHVFPSWCDSHTHLVFSGSRENEFVDRLKGLLMRKLP